MKIEYIPIDKLMLDPNNARFAELYNKSNKEEELIEYLLYEEAAEDVAYNISETKQYYPDEVLWVVQNNEKFLVKDGNRRCAAVKALQYPNKYGLSLPKMHISKLPVLIYKDDIELDRRIQEQHTSSLFKEWDRIAKALKAFEMHNKGSSEDAIREIDSDPSQLIKLANFYYEAVQVAGEDFKKLIRRGKGITGGKTIIFERLFSKNKLCGYKFEGKPSYKIIISDKTKFQEYINALVVYLINNPKTKHQDVDTNKQHFLDNLKPYGFIPTKQEQEVTKTSTSKTSKQAGTTKTRPLFERKNVPPKLKHIIYECYDLDNSIYANAKVALSRIVFETVLKFIIEETDYMGKKLKTYKHFYHAFNDKNKPRKYTNFSILRQKFIELIKNTDTRKTFECFDLDRINQIIHNYKTGAVPNDAGSISENLIYLIEFMLQDIKELLASLDTVKLT